MVGSTAGQTFAAPAAKKSFTRMRITRRMSARNGSGFITRRGNGHNGHNYYILPESTIAKPEWSIIDPQEYSGQSTNRNILSYQILIKSQLGKHEVQAVVVLRAEATPTTTNEDPLRTRSRDRAMAFIG